jgi:hypothetical protein
MRAPSFEQITSVIDPDFRAPGAAGSWPASSGGLDFRIFLRDRRVPPSIEHRLADDSRLQIDFFLRLHHRFGRFGPIRQGTWFNLELAGPEPDALPVRLATDLDDTRQLAKDPALARLTPLVEAALAAFLAAAPRIQAEYRAAETQRAAENAARDTRIQGEIAVLRERDLTDLEAFIALAQTAGPAPRLAELAPERRLATSWLRLGVSLDAPTTPEFQLISEERHLEASDYQSRDTEVRVVVLTRKARYHPARLLLDQRRRVGRSSATTLAYIEFETLEGWFERVEEIEQPALRGLATMLLRARAAALAIEAQTSALRQASAERQRTVVLARVEAGLLEQPASDDLVPVRITLPLIGRPSRVLAFRRQADGAWASDAVVAASRGVQGRKVYPEAIHLPAAWHSNPLDPVAPPAPASWDIGSAHLRELFGLPAIILGWVARPEYPRGLKPTADPSLWDHDYASDPAAPVAEVTLVAPAG